MTGNGLKVIMNGIKRVSKKSENVWLDYSRQSDLEKDPF